MITQTDYDFILNCQVKEFQSNIKGWYLSLDVEKNIAIINSDANSPDISVLRDNQEQIAVAALLKLGCKKIEFWHYNILLWDYNADISVDELQKMTAAVLNPVDQEQQQATTQAQFADDWISFEGISKILGVDVEDVEDETENFQIPITRRNRVLGLSEANLDAYLDKRHAFTKAQIKKQIPKSSNTAPRLQAVPNNNTNGYTPTAEGLRLPENFNMMEGRQRRPDIKTALNMAINALPNGESRKWDYIKQISMRENVESFLADLAAQFKQPEKAKQELITTARQLYDEYLDSGSAA